MEMETSTSVTMDEGELGEEPLEEQILEAADIRVLVTASGTGGHLFPARFVIEALQKDYPLAQIAFVGSGRALEQTIVGPTGVPLHAIKTVGLKRRGVRGVLEFLCSAPIALFQTVRLFLKFRPQVVVGLGGYATFFPVTLACLLRIPRWIHEAERKPGMANHVLSYYSTIVSLAFEDAQMPARASTRYTGHPVRAGLRRVATTPHVVVKPKRLLVMGGSQGAKAIDEIMAQIADLCKQLDLEVLHQCRPENEAAVRKAYGEAGVEARVMPFIEALDDAYEWSDVIVSRAGAGAVMEIGVVNRPAILVPYPFAQGDHQTANARGLVDNGKALLVPEGQGFESRLRTALEELCTPEAYREMQERKGALRKLDGADEIAKGTVELVSAPDTV